MARLANNMKLSALAIAIALCMLPLRLLIDLR